MPYKDPIKQREYRKQYYAKDREAYIIKTAEWRKINKEKRNESERKRNADRIRNDPEFREKQRLRSRRNYVKYRELRILLAEKHRGTEVDRARQILRNAVRRGEIIKPSQCGQCDLVLPLQGHHDDYSKPLEVIWLCPLCHGENHQLRHLVSNPSVQLHLTISPGFQRSL
jgi:hypothetical protein